MFATVDEVAEVAAVAATAAAAVDDNAVVDVLRGPAVVCSDAVVGVDVVVDVRATTVASEAWADADAVATPVSGSG